MYKPSQFKPAWWARNPHVQTIFADLLTNRRKPLGHKERLELDDGDFVDLVWTKKLDEHYSGPLLVLFHGLEGSIKSHYAYRLLKSLQDHDWPGVMMHFRGCSGEPNRLPRAYHSGETDDPRYFLEHLTARFPKAKLFAAGYSLGGNVLLKYLGKYKEDSLLHGAAAISPPLDLSACEIRLKAGFSRVYQHHLLSRMKRNLQRKLDLMPELDKHLRCTDGLNDINTFKAFDEQVTAPLHGFIDADDYYEKCSAMHSLQHITVPSLVLHAKDDPFMTHAVIPQPNQLSTQIEYELCNRGGHVGFISGKYPWRPHFYVEQRIAEFFKKIYNTC
jgi:predicted alpha/beta-fold hydrolase